MEPFLACSPGEVKERTGKQTDAKGVLVGGIVKKHCGVRLRGKNGYRVTLQGIVPVVADAFSWKVHGAGHLILGRALEA